ncbi:MAG: response regulator [Thiogranum sp.]|jgi:FixJ family two-component response regulator|nr:response regulator [Thiogranum sp.]
MTERENLFLVDDNHAVRHALRLFLESRGFVVHEFSSAEAFLEVIAAGDTGVIIVDLRLDGMSGLDLQAELKSRGIDLPTVFITGHGSIRDSVSALKEGAVDFIEKPFDNEVLLRSINDALRCEQSLRERRGVKRDLLDKFSTLTPREQQVLTYVVGGISNKSLAEQLGVSSRTIEVHRSRIMAKMGACSLPELVRMALLMGIALP